MAGPVTGAKRALRCPQPIPRPVRHPWHRSPLCRARPGCCSRRGLRRFLSTTHVHPVFAIALLSVVFADRARVCVCDCFSAIANNEEAIMQEIYSNGPIVAGFMVYADFPH